MSTENYKAFEHPACRECIKRQLDKYEGYVTDAGKVYRGFSVPCNGIPTEYISDKIKQVLSPEEQEDALAILDPVVWAKKYAIMPDFSPWLARWYQETMLRCTSRRKVSRCGRRIGKCLEKGTEVMTPSGPVQIQDLKPGDTVYGYNKDNNTVFTTKITNVYDRGIQEVVDLKKRNKTIASCTLEHRWHTVHDCGRVKPQVRHTGDFYKGIAISRCFQNIPLGNIYEKHAYSIGALLGDSCSRERGDKIYFSSEDYLIPDKVSKQLGCAYRKNKGKNYTWVLSKLEDNQETISCNYYNEWCKGRYAHEKTCNLDTIKSWNRQSCIEFLAGLLDTDGCVQLVNGCLEIGWTMQAFDVIKAIRFLILALFQYEANIGLDDRDKYKNGPVYYIKVKNNLFSKRILSELNKYLVVERKKWKQEYSDLIQQENNDFAGVSFDKDKTRLAHCYDISIDTADNLYLLANGLVTHNSDAIAIDMLHSCFTRKNTRVLVVAPYKAQTEEIIGRVRSFCRMNPTLQNAVKRDVSSPYYEISFHNGSRIRGFSSGTKSGAEGVGIRGQDADKIYLDEADYLMTQDLSAIIAILNTHPNVTLWASSTPTGKRQHFYRWCEDTPTYREFYYPSMVLPHWDELKDNIEVEYAGRPDDWTHEILAEWGEQTVGVFQNTYIDRATMEYKYEDQSRKPGWTYSMGVDWNSDVGTEICITGYDGHGIFHVVETKNIPKQEWTQIKGMEAIIELNEKWRPDFLYMDEGYGHTNVELLQKYGHDMAAKNPADPACNLRDKLVKYDFGSKVEIYDLTTQQPVKKDAKPFLVQNAVRRFEEDTIKISAFDSVLIRQLENYIIDHTSPAGRPTYGVLDKKLGDHRLDAFMLSLIAFKLEMSDFAQPEHATNIAISRGFSTKLTSQQDIENNVRRIPTSRYDLDDAPIISNADIVMPARVERTGHLDKVCSQEAWETDQEDEFKRKWELKQFKKRIKRRRILPGRTNF